MSPVKGLNEVGSLAENQHNH